MNAIWLGMIFISIICGIFTGNIDNMINELLKMPSDAMQMTINIIASVCFWNGILNVAKEAGIIDKIADFTKPILKHLLPEIKDDDLALGYISTNIAANMIGLGSAATPSGLKAMERMQQLNEDKKKASRSMVTFLILNTSGVTIVPTTIISLRALYHSTDATGFVIFTLIGTLVSLCVGLILDRYFYKREFH